MNAAGVLGAATRVKAQNNLPRAFILPPIFGSGVLVLEAYRDAPSSPPHFSAQP